MAQPALSRTIQNLEHSLGVTLFVRSNRNVEITIAGQSFLKGCREILNRTQQIVQDAQRVHQGKNWNFKDWLHQIMRSMVMHRIY